MMFLCVELMARRKSAGLPDIPLPWASREAVASHLRVLAATLGNIAEARQ
jgi:hypothetical protein